MGVHHRRPDVPVIQELLDRPDVIVVFQQAGSERMPQRVIAGVRADPRLADGVLNTSVGELGKPVIRFEPAGPGPSFPHPTPSPRRRPPQPHRLLLGWSWRPCRASPHQLQKLEGESVA